MKFYSLTILTLCSTTSVFGQLFSTENRKDSVFESAVRKAKISRHLVYKYTLNGNQPVDSSLVSETLYDKLGNAFEKIFYKEGKLEMRFNYTYADNLLNKVYEKNLKIPYTLVHEIEYDSLGNPFKEYAHTPKSSKGVAYAYIYNTNSQLTAIYRSFNKKGYYLFAEYIYENGKILQSQTYSTGVKDQFSILYEYDESNKTKTLYNVIGTGRTKVIVYSYDETGRLKKMSYAAGEVILTRDSKTQKDYFIDEAYFYNPDNTLSQINIIKEGKLVELLRHYYF